MAQYVLAGEDHSRFKDFFHPRVARRTRDAAPEALETIVAGLLATAQRKIGIGELHQAARLFHVHRGDGLSFIAERLAEIAAARLPGVQIQAFVGVRGDVGLPEVFKHVGSAASLRACARAGVYDGQFWRKVVIDALIIFAAIAIVFLADRLKPESGDATDTVVLLTALSAVLAGILTSHVKVGRDSEALKTLARTLDDGCARPDEARSPAVERAVTEMMRAFHGLKRPACVVIDDFSRIDPFSKAVLYEAMKVDRTGGTGAVFWIVVEQVEAGELARQLVTQAKGQSEYFSGQIEEYRVDPLTLEERVAVLRHHKLPIERAQDEVFVKALVRGANASEIDQITSILDALVQTESTADVRATTLLRVIVANTELPEFDLSEAEYIRIFSEQREGGRRRLFPILLSAYLENVPRLPKDRAADLIKVLRERLSRMVIPPKSPTDPLRIRRIGREALEQWHASQFPNESLDLFWFLWWHRSRFARDRSTSLLQKLAHHGSRARFDSKLLATPEGSGLAVETIHALMQVVDACLHQTLVTDALATARALLSNARSLQSTKELSGEITDKTWASIGRVCWQVYLASGAEEFLISVLSLLADTRYAAPAAEARGDGGQSGADVGEAFLRVMNASANELGVMSDALRKLLLRDEQLGARLRAQMRCRTLEIVARCERFAAPAGLVEKSGFPSSKAIDQDVDKKALVDICDDIYADAERRFTIIDHTVLRDALFYAVRARDLATAREIIPAFTLAPEAHTAAAARTGRPLTVLERAFRIYTVAVCLDALLRLAVAMSAPKRPRYQFQPKPTEFSFRNDIVPGALANDIRDVLAAAAGEFGGKGERISETEALSPAVLFRVSELYLQAAMAWEALGLEQLRNRTHMDRANFLFEFTSADPARPATFERVIQGLGPALSGHSMQAVMNHLEVAEFFDSVRQMRSLYVTEAVTRLLKLDVPSDLTLVFCMFLNGLPLGSAIEAATAANHVVKLLEDDEFLDHFVERFGAEQYATPALMNKLFNVGGGPAGGTLKERAFALVERLIAHPRLHPDVRQELTVHYDLRKMKEKPAPTTDGEVQAVLDAWGGRRDHWLYPAVLRYLLDTRAPSDAIIDESLRVLENDSLFGSSPAVLLTLRLGRIAADSNSEPLRERTIAVLRKAAATAGDWEIELAIESYELLIVLDRANAQDYEAQHIYWKGAQLQHAKTEAFAQWLHDGFYFGVFRSYWEGLGIYGLPHAPIDALWCRAVGDLLQAGDSHAAVKQCLERMQSQAPPMIVRPQNQACVADDYVLIGRVLFNSDVKVTTEEAAKELTIARQTINTAAGHDLRTLIDVVLMADTVPSGLRDIIRQQGQFILEELTTPRTAA